MSTETTIAIVRFFPRQRVPEYIYIYMYIFFCHGSYRYEICMSIVQHLSWRLHYYDFTTYYILYYIIMAASDYDYRLSSRRISAGGRTRSVFIIHMTSRGAATCKVFTVRKKKHIIYIHLKTLIIILTKWKTTASSIASEATTAAATASAEQRWPYTRLRHGLNSWLSSEIIVVVVRGLPCCTWSRGSHCRVPAGVWVYVCTVWADRAISSPFPRLFILLLFFFAVIMYVRL